MGRDSSRCSAMAQEEYGGEPVPEPPQPPAPGLPPTGIHQAAGVGGETAYATAGVLEIGGSGSFNFGKDLTHIGLRPFLGWFIADNLQISGILELQYAKVGDFDNTMYDIWAEPSYHYPFSNRVLLFVGVGGGVANNGEETGFAVRPRLGTDVLIGRSAIFRPTLEMTWSTVDIVTREGTTMVGLQTTYGMSFGFRAMW